MYRSNAVLSFAVANLRRVRFLWVRSVWLVGVFGLGLYPVETTSCHRNESIQTTLLKRTNPNELA